MRRFERRRLERLQRTAAVVGVSFALGALIATALWLRLQPTGAAARTEGARPTALVTNPRTGADEHPAALGTTGVVSESTATALLEGRLRIPVEGVQRRDLQDNFADERSGRRKHEAIDIVAPRGTPVRAVDDGTVAKLFTSRAGGITMYQFDPSGTFCYYYAHLDRYAEDLAEGQPITRGQVIGYVGSTGNASPDAPHLHFAIFRLGPERQWWKGDAINPYPLLAGD